jgi:hypothetical protein
MMLHLLGVLSFLPSEYDTPGIYLYDYMACDTIDHENRVAWRVSSFADTVNEVLNHLSMSYVQV